MVDRGEDLRFPFEAREAVEIEGEELGEDLNRE
jgi:hypothetical protein